MARNPLTRMLAGDGEAWAAAQPECDQMAAEVRAVNGSDVPECSSFRSYGCNVGWRSHAWQTSKGIDNYNLRWITGRLWGVTGRHQLGPGVVAKAKRRVALGDLVLSTHNISQSICLMCKALRWDEKLCVRLLEDTAASERKMAKKSERGNIFERTKSALAHNNVDLAHDRFVACFDKFRRDHEDVLLDRLKKKDPAKYTESEKLLLRRIDGEYAWGWLSRMNSFDLQLFAWQSELFQTQTRYYGCS